MIILRGVNLFPTQIEELVLGIPELSPHFILELTRSGRLDSLTVKVERRSELSDETSAQAGRLLVKQVKDRIGTSVQVSLVDAGSLARSEGKLKRLYDLRP
jgi:phenylacetate-CoA ligase